MNYELLEKELKKRLEYPYVWGKRQNNSLDKETNFIYKTFLFEDLLNKIEQDFSGKQNYINIKNYALNRWYNYWSAKAVEEIFCEHSFVKAHLNSKDKYVDFYIQKIPFDHKTTVFPKGFKKSVPYAHTHKLELINWLYANQSQQQRKHLKNRLFVVLVNMNDENQHWKLKAEILWLKEIVSAYLRTFEPQKLTSFTFENSAIKADIIWAVK
ncbi:hypothetical protein SAMN05444411_11349 [Lutibacter oricola]|uniref:Uncharacterized protein n=1 Tax=Lutibacter oricola TaxID=762486 RepID=A0A1H3G5N6_9FLAO|nr:hypothetical protein [Lutibacter oricola]SDX98355.1 hypothetical protein SAMN05444411_11349 [Lutibacter oricola]